jgi:hypothetical protein
MQLDCDQSASGLWILNEPGTPGGAIVGQRLRQERSDGREKSLVRCLAGNGRLRHEIPDLPIEAGFWVQAPCWPCSPNESAAHGRQIPKASADLRPDLGQPWHGAVRSSAEFNHHTQFLPHLTAVQVGEERVVGRHRGIAGWQVSVLR